MITGKNLCRRGKLNPMQTQELIRSAREGDDAARKELFSLLYADLRRIAHRRRQTSPGNDTLNTTALVHEAFLRLAGPEAVDWKDRAHVLAIAGTAMRHILVDAARRSQAQKRGEPLRIEIDSLLFRSERHGEEVLALDLALRKLGEIDERKSLVVQYQFFGGLTVADTAEVLSVSTATVKRDWSFARAWLYKQLSSGKIPRKAGSDSDGS
ncbi:MAG TPA: ECF-type sigma factor [Acidobacteriota bacterium]|nr:ECF-type sigma factor [Acidobacteriota bacterium]